MKIYIIEDDLIIAQNLKENLEELGYDVVGVGSSFEEVKADIQQSKPDLCLVDIYLKGSSKNGIEIVRYLQESMDIPFVYLTSFDDNEYRDRAKTTNPAAYLLKPSSKEQIDVTIDMALSNFYSKVSEGSMTRSCPMLKGDDLLFVKKKDRYEKIVQSEIVYIKAAGTYTQIITSHKTVLISFNLKKILPQLKPDTFVRSHRSYAVNKSFIEAFDDVTIYVNVGSKVVEVPLSRNQKEKVHRLLPRMRS